MHIIRISSRVQDSVPIAAGQSLAPGTDYLCPNGLVSQIVSTRWRVSVGGEEWSLQQFVQVREFQPIKFLCEHVNYNNGHIWIMRNGGFGDLLMLTPTLRALIDKWPTVTIHVICSENYGQALQGWKNVRTHLAPTPLADIVGASMGGPLVCFEDYIEGNPASKKTHIAQHFANAFGIDLKGDYKPTYYIDEASLKEVLAAYPRKSGKKRIGIQYTSPFGARSYPMPMTNVVIKALLEREYEVLLVGYPSQMNFKEPPEALLNTTERNYNFRQSAAALHTCDAILSPDSASAHLAAAMDIPCVSLFGPIDARLRVSGSQVRAMQGEAPCAPCNYHPAHANDFPAGQPCGKLGACLALTNITPEEIVTQLTELTSSGIITP